MLSNDRCLGLQRREGLLRTDMHDVHDEKLKARPQKNFFLKASYMNVLVLYKYIASNQIPLCTYTENTKYRVGRGQAHAC